MIFLHAAHTQHGFGRSNPPELTDELRRQEDILRVPEGLLGGRRHPNPNILIINVAIIINIEFEPSPARGDKKQL